LLSLLVVALQTPLVVPEPPPRTSKSCSRCGKDQPLDQFNGESRARDGRKSACRAYERIRRRATL